MIRSSDSLRFVKTRRHINTKRRTSWSLVQRSSSTSIVRKAFAHLSNCGQWTTVEKEKAFSLILPKVTRLIEKDFIFVLKWISVCLWYNEERFEDDMPREASSNSMICCSCLQMLFPVRQVSSSSEKMSNICFVTFHLRIWNSLVKSRNEGTLPIQSKKKHLHTLSVRLFARKCHFPLSNLDK